MKKFVTFIILVMYSYILVGECYKKEVLIDDFIPVLSPRHIWYAVEGSGWSPDSYYHRYKVDVTSIIIDNKSYQQVLISLDSIGNNWRSTKKYVREDEGKVWMIDSTSYHNIGEVCILDMNLALGDEFSYIDGVFIQTRKFVVTAVDSITDLGGQIRKVIYLSCDFDPSFRYRWIEGIGSDVGVFSSTFEHCVVDGNENSLTCFYEGDVQFWQSEVFNHCWKPSPPSVETLIPILNPTLIRYMVINKPIFPHQKMERWKFNFFASTKENFKTYYELLISDKEEGNNFIGSGRFFREEDNRFYQYISP